MPIRRRPAGRGAFGSGTSRNGQLLKRRRRPGVPSSWGTLMCLRPALRPRRDRDCQAIAATRHGPTCIQRRGLSTTGNIGARSHGIGARCLRFAVRFTPPHARLASGCPARLYQAGLATRRAPTKGFRDASYIASPFPKLPWRNECPQSCSAHQLLGRSSGRSGGGIATGERRFAVGGCQVRCFVPRSVKRLGHQGGSDRITRGRVLSVFPSDSAIRRRWPSQESASTASHRSATWVCGRSRD
jgi:hypothetical protein